MEKAPETDEPLAPNAAAAVAARARDRGMEGPVMSSPEGEGRRTCCAECGGAE